MVDDRVLVGSVPLFPMFRDQNLDSLSRLTRLLGIDRSKRMHFLGMERSLVLANIIVAVLSCPSESRNPHVN